MIKVWIIFGLEFSLSLFWFHNICAQNIPNSSYYLYSDKSIKLHPSHFHYFIIPQLKKMTKEYHLILKKLHPSQQYLIKFKKDINQMLVTLESFKVSCQKKSKESSCQQNIEIFLEQAQKIDHLIAHLRKEQKMFIFLKSQNKIQDFIHLFRVLNQIEIENYKLMHQLERYSITVHTHYFFPPKSNDELTVHLHKMLYHSEVIQNLLLEEKLKQDFNFVWHNFFKPIESYIVIKKNSSFLLRDLESLNIAWNTFHMKITKGNHNLPKKINSLAKIMHNRWNSVLKKILRN